MDQVSVPKGVYAAVATPFDEDFKPDWARYASHCQWLLDHGCDGLAPLGTTGEANSIGHEMRLKIIRFLSESGLPMSRMIIGTGSTSIDDTLKLSRAAIEGGAGGLLLLPPFYYSNPSEDGLFAYFSAIAEDLKSSRPQLFLYHIPMFSDVAITVPLVARLRDAFPGLFVGLKDSAGDFDYTLKFLKAFPGFAAFSGTEIFANRNLIAGGWGCISATANVTAPAVKHRIRGRSKNARALDAAIDHLREVIAGYGTIHGTKAYLAMLKDDPAWRRVLPPNTEFVGDPKPLKSLFASLEANDELQEIFKDCIHQ